MIDRRGFLRRFGLVGGGVGAGLLARPIATDLTETSEKIIEGIYTFDSGFLHIALTGEAASGILIEDSEGDYIYRWPYISIGDPSVRTDRRIESGQYRAIAVRRNYDGKINDDDVVQEVRFKVTKQ